MRSPALKPVRTLVCGSRSLRSADRDKSHWPPSQILAVGGRCERSLALSLCFLGSGRRWEYLGCTRLWVLVFPSTRPECELSLSVMCCGCLD